MKTESLMLSLPFFLPVLGAITTYFAVTIERYLKLFFLALHLTISAYLCFQAYSEGIQTLGVGNWMVPYGIILIIDPFASCMLLASSLIFFCCLLEEDSDSAPLLFFLQAGVSLSFLTGDFFNLFVALELMLISSYAIMVTRGDSSKLTNMYSYLSMNIIASFLYLIAVAIFYGYTGSLNFAVLGMQFTGGSHPLAIVLLISILLVVAIKGGLFPLYFWLPDSYPILPSHLGALFGGILSKVGIYAFYRLMLTIFNFSHPILNQVVLILSCLTMFLGVIGAVSKVSIKDILSYHILSQVGYMIFALILGTPMAIAAGIFFIIHNMIVKASLFLIGGVASRKCQSDNLSKMGGLWGTVPILGLLFIIQAFSLAGIPPLSGFWGKYLIIQQAVAGDYYLSTIIALATSFLTLFSMIKIWNSAFLTPLSTTLEPVTRKAYIGPIILCLVALVMGFYGQGMYYISYVAAEKLLDQSEYISLSLNSGNKGRKT